MNDESPLPILPSQDPPAPAAGASPDGRTPAGEPGPSPEEPKPSPEEIVRRESETLHPELLALFEELRETRALAHRLAADLSDAQAWWRPDPERWSVAECIDHLTVTAEQLLPRLRGTIVGAHPPGERAAGPLPGSFRRGLLSRLLIAFTEPPPRLRMRAPAPYAPEVAEGELVDRVLGRFDRAHEELEAQVLESRGLDLGRVKMTSPFSRLLRLSLRDWFAFLAAHERRHLWQADQVRQHPGFPSD